MRKPAAFVALAFILLAGGCNRSPGPGVLPDDAGPELPDSGPACAIPCGASCCAETQVCNPATLLCDTPTCSESPREFCDRLGVECGSVTARDKCGELRTWNCGGCRPGQACGPDYRCACAPPTDAQLCAAHEVACGPLSTTACGDARTVDDCGQCAGGFVCQQGSCVPCNSEDDKTFCTSLDRQCGPATGFDQCGLERSVRSCGTCTFPQVCERDGHCGRIGTVENDECAGATPLDFGSGVKIVLQGENLNATHSGPSAGCGGSGPDVVYVLTLPHRTGLEISLDPVWPPAGWRSILFLRTDCGSPDEAAELACADDPSGFQRLILGDVPAGRLYIWVKGRDQLDAGTFTLEIRATGTRVPPDHDTCRAPWPLTFVGDVATLNDDTTMALDNSGGCGNQAFPGGDLVYALTLNSEASITARVSSVAPWLPDFEPVVYLRSDCAVTGQERVCARALLGVATLQVPRLKQGTHYLFVDSTDPYGGPCRLEVTKAPPILLPDSCSQAKPILLAPGQYEHVAGDTTWVEDDGGSARCGPSPGHDLVYAITTSAAGSFSAWAGFADSSIGARLYLRRDCASTSAADEIGCDDGFPRGDAELHVTSLPAGTYYLWVDSDARSGPFGLGLRTSDLRPANDSCAAPETIALDVSGHGATSGDISRAHFDIPSRCGGGSNDLVYEVTTDSEKTVQFTLTPGPTATSFRPFLELRSTCQVYYSSWAGACAMAPNSGMPAQLSIPRLPAGTWYLRVAGGDSGSPGAFRLEVDATDPPPIQDLDRCNPARPLSFDASGRAIAVGDTTLASARTTGTCVDATGPEVVYAFTQQQAQKVTATVVSDPWNPQVFSPVVYLRSDCDSSDASAERTCQQSRQGTATAVVNSLPPGTWYLWVDGESGSSGGFTLTVNLESPVAGPANDSCATAERLDLRSGSATVTGTTINALGSTEGSCHVPGFGVVYELPLAGDSMITATVTGLGSVSFSSLVILRRGCASGLSSDELACEGTSYGYPVTVPFAKAGTYYLWVQDSRPGRSDDFTLTVQIAPPVPPPPNDTCAGAEALVPWVIVQGDTTNALDDYGAGPLSGPCDPRDDFGRLPGRDVVYSYTPQTSGDFTVTVVPQSSFDPVVWVTTTCGGTGSSCAVASADGCWSGCPEKLTVGGTAGTTYYIVVDAASRSQFGSFSLRVH